MKPARVVVDRTDPAASFSARPAARAAAARTHPRAAATTMAAGDEALLLPTRADFDALARRDDVPGALGVREVKILITRVDTDRPTLHFINTNRFVYHYDFAVRVLGERRPLGVFNRVTYFRDQRENLAGTLLAHDRFGTEGLFALEFWPTDPVPGNLVGVAFGAVTAGMPFAAGRIAYHPAGDTQEATFARDQARLAELGVRVVRTQELFGDLTYSPLNLGVGFGSLRLIAAGADDRRPASVRDVVVFEALPADLTHVAGVVTEAPQTPLSHVNLKARQNDTPNCYLRDARNQPQIAAHLGGLVRLEVGADALDVRPATAAEVDEHLERLRPPVGQRPAQDLSVRRAAPLSALGHVDSVAYGAKAANVAELRRVLPAAQVPDGWAVPFRWYTRFMWGTGLRWEVRRLVRRDDVRADPAVREEALADLRERIEDADVPRSLLDDAARLHERFPADQPLRCRSSTNNEDLVGFNGAGLYDSFTHRPDEGPLAETLKQVWASLWNFRAYEEREFYRIDHSAVSMGVLVHPNYDDEIANGVAVTKNVYDPNWPGFYINVQVGESLVTNPDPAAVPDELLVSAIGEHGEYETQYIRRSSLAGGGTVMTAAQVADLVVAMERIQAHFARVYERPDDPTFAMDIEFKVTVAGDLVVKQARPWVD